MDAAEAEDATLAMLRDKQEAKLEAAVEAADQWLDLAPGSHAWIEARDTWSTDWLRLTDGWYWSGNGVIVCDSCQCSSYVLITTAAILLD